MKYMFFSPDDRALTLPFTERQKNKELQFSTSNHMNSIMAQLAKYDKIRRLIFFSLFLYIYYKVSKNILELFLLFSELYKNIYLLLKFRRKIKSLSLLITYLS